MRKNTLTKGYKLTVYRDLEGIKVKDYDVEVKARTNYVKDYGMALVLAGLNKYETLLFHWMVESADNNNEVRFMATDRERFMKVCNSIFDVKYNDRHASGVLTRLNKSGLIVRVNNGLYIINPFVCFVGDTFRRQPCIKKIFESSKVSQDVKLQVAEMANYISFFIKTADKL